MGEPSKTPRTDAIVGEISDLGSAVGLIPLARQLERELAEAQTRIKGLEEGSAKTSVALVRAGIPAFGWNHEAVDQLAAKLAEATSGLSKAACSWIPVGERLPEVGIKVLTFTPPANQEMRLGDIVIAEWGTGSTEVGRMIRPAWSGWNKHPTHWMPLPEAPK